MMGTIKDAFCPICRKAMENRMRQNGEQGRENPEPIEICQETINAINTWNVQYIYECDLPFVSDAVTIYGIPMKRIPNHETILLEEETHVKAHS